MARGDDREELINFKELFPDTFRAEELFHAHFTHGCQRGGEGSEPEQESLTSRSGVGRSPGPGPPARALRCLCGRVARTGGGAARRVSELGRGGRAGCGRRAPRAERGRGCVGLGAERIMPRPRTEEKTENEIALAS